MIQIEMDAGHGENTYNDTGSKGVPGLEEHHFNAAVVGYAKEIAERCGFEVHLTQPLYGKDVPLINRTNNANARKSDMLLSFHADANKPEVRGHWAFYWYKSPEGKRMADLWSKHLANETGTKHRGNQPCVPGTWTDFHMVRETNMVAVLMEHAFMTNKDDLKLLQSDKFRKQCAVAVVKALCEYYRVKYVEEPKAEAQSVQSIDKNQILYLAKTIYDNPESSGIFKWAVSELKKELNK